MPFTSDGVHCTHLHVKKVSPKKNNYFYKLLSKYTK